MRAPIVYQTSIAEIDVRENLPKPTTPGSPSVVVQLDGFAFYLSTEQAESLLTKLTFSLAIAEDQANAGQCLALVQRFMPSLSAEDSIRRTNTPTCAVSWGSHSCCQPQGHGQEPLTCECECAEDEDEADVVNVGRWPHYGLGETNYFDANTGWSLTLEPTTLTIRAATPTEHEQRTGMAARPGFGRLKDGAPWPS